MTIGVAAIVVVVSMTIVSTMRAIAMLLVGAISPLVINVAGWVVARRLPLRPTNGFLEVVPPLVMRVILRDPSGWDSRLVRRRGVDGAWDRRRLGAVILLVLRWATSGIREVLVLLQRRRLVITTASPSPVLLSRVITVPCRMISGRPIYPLVTTRPTWEDQPEPPEALSSSLEPRPRLSNSLVIFLKNDMIDREFSR